MTDAAASPRAPFDDFDAAPCGLLVASADAITRVNATFLAMTGLRESDVLGHRFSQLLDAGSRLFFETRAMPVLRLSGEAREVSLAITRPSAEPVAVLVNLVAIGDEFHVAVFDSTQRRDYERQLLETQRASEVAAHRVQVLQGASVSFGSTESESALASALVQTMRAAFSAPYASVEFVDGAGQLEAVAGTFPFGSARDTSPDSVPARAMQQHEVITIASIADASPAVAEAMMAGSIEFFACAPLLDDGQVLGVVTVYFSRQRDTDDKAAELMAALARQGAQMLTRIRLQAQLTQLALHDGLTGLANRKLLSERLEQVLSASARHSSGMAALFLDLDGFKAVNDTLGHPVGDGVLAQVADRLRSVVRTGDTIGRFGGDEFVVICEAISSSDALVAAERIRAALSAPYEHVDDLPISASIGVATGTATSETTAAHVLGLADVAMYESKRAGRDRLTSVEF